MSKKTRYRQLARQHQRRREKEAERQQRRTTVIAIAALLGLITLGLVGSALGFGGSKERAASSATPSAPVSPSANPTAPPKVTGTVQPAPGPTTVACGEKAPTSATKPKPQFASAPPMTIDPKKTYTATLHTSCGDIVVELDAKNAPQTVNSFVFLAEQGYFEGQRIHRLDTSIDVIQGGDPTGTGQGGPGYTIPDELTGKESYAPGVLAMANAGPNSGGSQFFFITGPNGHKLDAQAAWTIFGHIVKGMDVAQEIQQLPITDPQAAASGDLSGQQPADAVYIDRVTIQTQR